MKHFHLYHFILLLFVSIIFFQKQFFVIGIIYIFLLFALYLTIRYRYQDVRIDFRKPYLHMTYGMIQLMLIVLLVMNEHMFASTIIGMLLISHYVFCMEVTRIHFQTNLTFTTLTDEIERFDDLFLSIRTERHDYVRHIHVLHHFLEDDKSLKAKKYLQTLIGDYSIISESIKREQGHIASVLYQCHLRATNENIDVHLELDQPLSRLPIQLADQVNLLTNLLNNAVEAASESEANKKEIKLLTSLYSGFYKIHLQNNAKRPPKHILNHLFERFGETTKGEDHEGLGTYIIAKIVYQYGGEIDYMYDHGKMTIMIQLPVIEARD